MTDFFTGSLLFNQINIIQYANRPFSNTDDMNECIINNINSIVKDNDRLYIVGNFLFGPLDNLKFIRTARWFRNRINCRNIFLLYGNHDRRAKKMDEFNRLFVKASDYLEIVAETNFSSGKIGLKGGVVNKLLSPKQIEFGKHLFESDSDRENENENEKEKRIEISEGNFNSQTVILMSYPIEEGCWNRANKGAWHFFSSTKPIQSEKNSKRFNVGIDFAPYYLLKLEGKNRKLDELSESDLRSLYRPYSFKELQQLEKLGAF